MKRIENVMYGVKCSFTEAHKSFPIHYGVWGGGFLKRIVINLPPTKDNEINMFHSDVQKNVSYTRSHKRFLIYYGLSLETVGYVFLIVFHCLFLLC